MKKKLQFMDIINDEEDKDTSFVPSAILDHRILRIPHCEVHKSKNMEGKEVIYIKVRS